MEQSTANQNTEPAGGWLVELEPAAGRYLGEDTERRLQAYPPALLEEDGALVWTLPDYHEATELWAELEDDLGAGSGYGPTVELLLRLVRADRLEDDRDRAACLAPKTRDQVEVF